MSKDRITGRTADYFIFDDPWLDSVDCPPPAFTEHITSPEKIRFKRIEFFDDGSSTVTHPRLTPAEWAKNYPSEAE